MLISEQPVPQAEGLLSEHSPGPLVAIWDNADDNADVFPDIVDWSDLVYPAPDFDQWQYPYEMTYSFEIQTILGLGSTEFPEERVR